MFSLDARLLFKVLHLKGDKKGIFAISIILDSDEEELDYMRLECCNYCETSTQPKTRNQGHDTRLRSGLTDMLVSGLRSLRRRV